MARIWYDGAGAILRFCKTEAEELFYGAPSGATGSVAFDETTNATAIAGLNSDWNAHTCPAGVLKRNGVNVTINADSATKTEIADLLDQAAAAITTNNTYLAIGSPSNAQNLTQIRALSQQMNRVIRRLVRLGKLQG